MKESTQSSVSHSPIPRSSLELSWELRDFAESGSLDMQPLLDHFLMLLLIFLFGSYIINALKTVSPPPNKGAKETSPPKKACDSLANEKNPPHQNTT
jgi:biopolymer transport protein ExbD